LFVVAHNGNPYATGDFAEKKMIRKSFQVGASSMFSFEMKSLRVGGSGID
jgi:hypothetical protein